jgi:hypothetical protein
MTHIVANGGDKRSLCGVKDPVPVVGAKFVQAHVEGWGMEVCPECLVSVTNPTEG